MTNKFIVLSLLTVLFSTSAVPSHAYNLNIDVNYFGRVNYSYPAVLGKDSDSGKSEDRPAENKPLEEKPPEVKPSESRPEKIEIKKTEKKLEVEIKKNDKSSQKVNPEKVNLIFSASPKTEVSTTPKPEKIKDVFEDRKKREAEKVELKSETSETGEVELHLESRNTEAKINDDSIELDLKSNNIASPSGVATTKSSTLNHLPDQAIEQFRELGVTTVTETLEVGQSADSFEYKVRGTKTLKLFGLIPRETQVDLTLNDSTGNIEQQKIGRNVFERLLNTFTF